jgi:hypothetical protein
LQFDTNVSEEHTFSGMEDMDPCHSLTNKHEDVFAPCRQVASNVANQMWPTKATEKEEGMENSLSQQEL